MNGRPFDAVRREAGALFVADPVRQHFTYNNRYTANALLLGYMKMTESLPNVPMRKTGSRVIS